MGEHYAPFGEPLLERPNWFGRRLLTADDLDLQQSYVRERMRRRNRMLHGWGVVNGLSVAAGDALDLSVSPGFALDPAGNEIIVPSETTIDARLAGLATPDEPHYLAVRWDETPTGELPAPRPNEPPVAAAWREDFELSILYDPPSDRLDESGKCTTPWVALATVVWDGGETLTVDEAVRRPIQLPVEP